MISAAARRAAAGTKRSAFGREGGAIAGVVRRTVAAALSSDDGDVRRQLSTLTGGGVRGEIPASEAKDLLQTFHAQGVSRLRSVFDDFIVGHEDLKEALLLGLVAREHVYIEGPPGVAKTMLAEVTSEATDMDMYFYQLHRDTRLSELVGESVITREEDAATGGGGSGTSGRWAMGGGLLLARPRPSSHNVHNHHGTEVIRQTNRRGGILTSEICVLDDISRAPGEALNVLLRILNERKFDGQRIPLVTGIATGNPSTDDYYTEALDPATLDRFTIQLKTTGLISAESWADALKLVEHYSGSGGLDEREVAPNQRVKRELLDDAYGLMRYVVVPEDVQRYLLTFLHTLQERFRLDESNALLTDRTFLVKSLKVSR